MSQEKNTVKESLKALGYNSRMVSVKEEYGGYSSVITATIRDERVNYQAVEKAVKKAEHYTRCEMSGEILEGGNTYTNVRISEEVQRKWAAHYAQNVTNVLLDLAAQEGNYGRRTADGKFCLFLERHTIKIWQYKTDRWMDRNYHMRDVDGISLDLFLATQTA